MSAAKWSRNNPSPSPCSTEQLPFPWPGAYCCWAGRHEQWSCTCQHAGGAIIPARRNKAMKRRHTPWLAQRLSALELLSCQTNGQFCLPPDLTVLWIQSASQGTGETSGETQNKSGQSDNFINFPWENKRNLSVREGRVWESLTQMLVLFAFFFICHFPLSAQPCWDVACLPGPGKGDKSRQWRLDFLFSGGFIDIRGQPPLLLRRLPQTITSV